LEQFDIKTELLLLTSVTLSKKLRWFEQPISGLDEPSGKQGKVPWVYEEKGAHNDNLMNQTIL